MSTRTGKPPISPQPCGWPYWLGTAMANNRLQLALEIDEIAGQELEARLLQAALVAWLQPEIAWRIEIDRRRRLWRDGWRLLLQEAFFLEAPGFLFLGGATGGLFGGLTALLLGEAIAL